MEPKLEQWCINAAIAIHRDINDRRGFDLFALDDDILDEWVDAHAVIIAKHAQEK